MRAEQPTHGQKGLGLAIPARRRARPRSALAAQGESRAVTVATSSAPGRAGRAIRAAERLARTGRRPAGTEVAATGSDPLCADDLLYCRAYAVRKGARKAAAIRDRIDAR